MPDYFNSSDSKETDKRVSEAITNRIHNEFNDVFSVIACFESISSLEVKEGSGLYQKLPRRVGYVLQNH